MDCPHRSEEQFKRSGFADTEQQDAHGNEKNASPVRLVDIFQVFS